MNYIYCYTNKVNGHKYVGQTNNIERRKREHLSCAFNPNSKDYNYLFHKKIREYGIDNFIFSILEETTEDKVNEAEIYWIKEMHSSVKEDGYNLTEGGQPPVIESIYEKDIEEIKKAIKNGVSYSEINKQYGISISHISAINHGNYYFDENETYPLYKFYNNDSETQYIKDLLISSNKPMTEIAKETGMSYSTIKKINSGALQYDASQTYPLRKESSGEQRANEIKKMLLEKKTNQEIISITGVSATTIKRINNGTSYYDSNLSYPLR